ncbi:MAG TPA: hypothetical protein VME43_22945 [Bryobacteraceae bacterium]|nr:hypothetical protein [Bryobacteraceae bacterium]
MHPAGPNSADSGAPDPEASRLVACLQSLMEGESAVAELAACGPRAIPPLREFLLAGRVASVPQPRMWAVDALALLGAREVLIEYLQSSVSAADPQLQFAEDAVRNTAGRRLSAWRDDQTFEILLTVARRRQLPGVIETLAGFGRVEAMPCLDRALEDDLCRGAAEDGFRKLGPAARGALLVSAATPLPLGGEETPSSLCRRRSVLGLLAEIGVEPENWPELRPLLEERDPEMLTRLAQIAATVADAEGRARAARALVGALEGLPWFVRKDAEAALVALAPESRAPIQAEVARRSAKPPLVRAGDEVLRMLLRIRPRTS